MMKNLALTEFEESFRMYKYYFHKPLKAIPEKKQVEKPFTQCYEGHHMTLVVTQAGDLYTVETKSRPSSSPLIQFDSWGPSKKWTCIGKTQDLLELQKKHLEDGWKLLSPEYISLRSKAVRGNTKLAKKQQKEALPSVNFASRKPLPEKPSQIEKQIIEIPNWFGSGSKSIEVPSVVETPSLQKTPAQIMQTLGKKGIRESGRSALEPVPEESEDTTKFYGKRRRKP